MSNIVLNEDDFNTVAKTMKIVTLSELATYSLEQVVEKVGDKLAYANICDLYYVAEARNRQNITRERQVITHANPQLLQAVTLEVPPARVPESVYGNDFIPDRSLDFVPEGHAGSMFAPTAYLTELYCEARGLHKSDSPFHIDKRRPDLTNLPLSQSALDTPVPILSLSNKLLQQAIQKRKSWTSDQAVFEELANDVTLPTGSFNHAFTGVKASLDTRDVQLNSLLPPESRPKRNEDTVQMLCTDLGIPPRLYAQLATRLTDDNLASEYEKVFGGIAPESLLNEQVLALRYNLPEAIFKETLLVISKITVFPIDVNDDNKAKLIYLDRAVQLNRTLDLSVPLIFNLLNDGYPDKSLQAFSAALRFQRHYSLNEETAGILAGSILTVTSDSDEPSQYDRVFNVPPLNGFYMDWHFDINLDLKAEPLLQEQVKYFDRIRHSLGLASHIELQKLVELLSISQSDHFFVDIYHLSSLYRVKLLADIHGLTVTELALLLSLLHINAPLIPGAFLLAVDKVYAVTNWLTANQLTVADLLVMTTQTFDTTLTPEISTLLVSLKDDIVEPIHYTLDALLKVLASHFNAVLGLESEKSVIHLLTSLGDKSVNAFWGKVSVIKTEDIAHSEGLSDVIKFCHQLAQRALIVQHFSLSEKELELAVRYPEYFAGDFSTILSDVSVLMRQSRFHDVLNQTGDKASIVLTSFLNQSLAISQLADAFKQPEASIRAILSATIGLKDEKETLQYRDFNCVALIQLWDWLQATKTLGVSSEMLNSLYNYTEKVFDAIPYNVLQRQYEALQTGLSQQQREAVTGRLDAALSTALSEYYIKYAIPEGVTLSNRDELFTFLLIDNQSSSGIMTSSIAEAISSLQLYINRCFYEPTKEPGVIDTALSRDFFKNWETYNKHYSTWAGVSMLAYFPENYIDPTARVGQTGMMDTLSQSISQRQLTPESVEEAFNAYLTAFEKVANLTVISGYHDDPSPNSGKTYFIGKSLESTPTYYWRSVDHSMFDKEYFPAYAWTEWKIITASAIPYKGLIRPVVFRSRLYLLWLEQRQAKAKKQDQPQKEDHWEYLLKLSFLNYDGSWSSPFILETMSAEDSKINNIFNINNLGLYCSSNENTNLLQILLYEMDGNGENYNKNTTSVYWTIDASLDIKLPPLKPIDSIKNELDTIKERKIANCFILKDAYDLVSFNPQGPVKDVRIVGHDANFITFSVDAFVTEDEDKWLAEQGLTKHKFKVDINGNNYNFQFSQGKDRHYVRVYISPEFKESKRVKIRIGENEGFSILEGLDNTYMPFNEHREYKMAGYNFTANVMQFIENIPSLNLYYKFSDNDRYQETTFEPLPSNNAHLSLEISDEDNKVSVSTIGKKFYESNHAETFTVQIPIDKFEQAPIVKLSIKRILSDDIELRIGESTITLQYHPPADSDVLHLKTSQQKAQYLEWGDETKTKLRLNTLFAQKLVGKASEGLDVILSIETQRLLEPPLGSGEEEVMDFSGANAQNFWELFYYVPMQIAQRFLEEQQFNEATRWFNFVFNPAGYGVGLARNRFWNMRPLLEDEAWSKEPLDSTDPDAVAQSDPMHYKAATLMHRIELHITRGDQAYRQLERDSMNEAKMWYLQALALMGTESRTTVVDWGNPLLSTAVKSVSEKSRALEGYQAVPISTIDVSAYSANRLVSLFHPQTNADWQTLRQTLTHRLYNLRHNLSLDGQPLSLPLFASPADPAQLHNVAMSASQGSTPLPQGIGIGLMRFPQSLDSARNLVGQLIQFGSTLMNVIERQDAEQMAGLMQVQSTVLMDQSMAIQKKTQAELKVEKKALAAMKAGATERKTHYKKLYDENTSATEKHIMNMRYSISSIQTVAAPLLMTGAAAQMAPNIFGVANGGSKWGAIATASGLALQFGGQVTQAVADGLTQSEGYARRREEWYIMWRNAKNEEDQIESQLNALALREDAAAMQLDYIKTQQAQLQAQLSMMQRKFSNEKLFGWMRGRLSALYFQFYDQVVSRCLRAEAAFKWETGQKSRFIKPGAWQSTWAGLLCGEGLSLSLTEMETAYQNWEGRALEVERTVSLNKHIKKLQKTIRGLVSGKPIEDSKDIKLSSETLSVSVALSDLKLQSDYPDDLNMGKVRRIKQISVTLPGLVGPYQDIQAVLSYGGSTQLPAGCTAIAISRGMNDSGQFQLDFNDGKYLPFEGINIGDTGNLTLRFPNARTKQETLLNSLSDIIFHVRYTIRD